MAFSILAMNRDESFNRSSTSIQHQTDLNIICGRDLEKGGTWLAADLKGNLFNCLYIYYIRTY